MKNYKSEFNTYSGNSVIYEVVPRKNLFELIQEYEHLFKPVKFNDLTRNDPVLLLNLDEYTLSYELIRETYETGHTNTMGIKLLNLGEFEVHRYSDRSIENIKDDLTLIFSGFNSFMKSDYIYDNKLKVKFMDILNDLLG